MRNFKKSIIKATVLASLAIFLQSCQATSPQDEEATAFKALHNNSLSIIKSRIALNTSKELEYIASSIRSKIHFVSLNYKNAQISEVYFFRALLGSTTSATYCVSVDFEGDKTALGAVAYALRPGGKYSFNVLVQNEGTSMWKARVVTDERVHDVCTPKNPQPFDELNKLLPAAGRNKSTEAAIPASSAEFVK